MKIGILGLGQMGGAILQGLLKKGGVTAQATTSSPASAQAAAKKYGIPVHNDGERLVRESDFVIVAVKPHLVQKVLAGLAKSFTAKHAIISVASGATIAQLKEWSGGQASILRAMPNTPALVGAGMTFVCQAPNTKPEHTQATMEIFQSVGRAVLGDESLMDGVVGLSGCGPAYLYLVIEALADGGVRMGLPRAMALELAAQTCLGAARMVLETGQHPGALKDAVTTPGGCTIEAISALENGQLRATMIAAVTAAAEKNKSFT